MAESSANSFGSPLPVFRVKDVDASVAYYLEALGFELRWRAGDEFACVGREKCSIFLTGDNQSQPRMWVWIGVQDVRALHRQYVTSGAKIRNPPNNFDWAMEIQVEDLDGNVLRIGSDPEKEKPLGVCGTQMGFVGDIWAIKGMSASIEERSVASKIFGACGFGPRGSPTVHIPQTPPLW